MKMASAQSGYGVSSHECIVSEERQYFDEQCLAFVCRLCLGSNDQQMCQILLFAEKIDFVTKLNVSVEDDGLPAFICNQCTIELNQANVFIQRSVKNDTVLRSEQAMRSASACCAAGLRVSEQLMSAALSTNIKTADSVDPLQLDVEEIILVKQESKDYFENNVDIVDGVDTVDCQLEFTESLTSEAVAGVTQKSTDHILDLVHAENNFLTGIKVEFSSVVLKTQHNADPFHSDSAQISLDVGNNTAFFNNKRFSRKEKVNQASTSNSKNISSHKDRKITTSKNFTCKFCNESFMVKTYYNLHLRSHAKYSDLSQCRFRGQPHGSKSEEQKENISKAYPCDHCKKSFIRESSLLKHNYDLHGLGKCNAKFARREMLNIHNKHIKKEKRFKCKECAREFTNSMVFKYHTKSHDRQKWQKCCGKYYSDLPSLLFHIKKHTVEVLLERVEGSGDSRYQIYKRRENTRRPLKCAVCSRYFTSRFTLMRHVAMHVDRQKYDCKSCGAIFTRIGNLKKHKKMDHTSCCFKCEICGKGFESKLKLYQHEQVWLGEEKHYMNSECARGFLTQQHGEKLRSTSQAALKSPVSLKSVESIHENVVAQAKSERQKKKETQNECPTCKKLLSSRDSLHRHLSTHGVRQIFQCTSCKKSYARADTLNLHIRKIHPIIRTIQ